MPVAEKPSLYRRLKERLVPSKREVIEKLSKAVHWSDRRIPSGVRTLAGIPLIVGGLLSFLPILGLWMLPLGIALIALDFPGTRRRMLDWIEKQERRHGLTPQPRRQR